MAGQGGLWHSLEVSLEGHRSPGLVKAKVTIMAAVMSPIVTQGHSHSSFYYDHV